MWIIGEIFSLVKRHKNKDNRHQTPDIRLQPRRERIQSPSPQSSPIEGEEEKGGEINTCYTNK